MWSVNSISQSRKFPEQTWNSKFRFCISKNKASFCIDFVITTYMELKFLFINAYFHFTKMKNVNFDLCSVMTYLDKYYWNYCLVLLKISYSLGTFFPLFLFFLQGSPSSSFAFHLGSKSSWVASFSNSYFTLHKLHLLPSRVQ